MILVADSGASSAKWALCSGKREFKIFKTSGINPNQENISEEDFQGKLKNELKLEEGVDIDALYFYGAGCRSPQNRDFMERVFQGLFPRAHIEVYHDLLGAARGLCGHEAGLACILGTGSNACYYDGQEIKSPARSLGYILGDEGSGAYLGKKLIRAYFQESLGVDLREKLAQFHNMERDFIIQKVYQGEYPNRFLASFAPFIKDHVDHMDCQKLLKDAFHKFFDRYLEPLKTFESTSLYFTGSIAEHFQDFLKPIALEKGWDFRGVQANPLLGLIKYHLSQESKIA